MDGRSRVHQASLGKAGPWSGELRAYEGTLSGNLEHRAPVSMASGGLGVPRTWGADHPTTPKQGVYFFFEVSASAMTGATLTKLIGPANVSVPTTPSMWLLYISGSALRLRTGCVHPT